MKIGFFVKRPVVIEAVQWYGSFDQAVEIITEWMGEGVASVIQNRDGKPPKFRITTLEGEMVASPGDWIVKGVKGEFYPCKPDIFMASYEPAP